AFKIDTGLGGLERLLPNPVDLKSVFALLKRKLEQGNSKPAMTRASPRQALSCCRQSAALLLLLLLGLLCLTPRASLGQPLRTGAAANAAEAAPAAPAAGETYEADDVAKIGALMAALDEIGEQRQRQRLDKKAGHPFQSQAW
ncbi:hypothetical protein BOX15_Mlig006115g4, partial [Macrostomum lignano]